MPESYFLYHFLAFSRVRNSTTFFKISFFQQPQANQEFEAVPPESLFLYHLRGHFLPPRSGTVCNSWGRTLSTLVSLYVFPYLGLIGPSLEKPKINWKPSGHIGGTISSFRPFWCYVYNITWFNLCFLSFVFLFFLLSGFSFVFSYALLCYVSTVLTNKKARPKDKENKK